MTKLVLMASVLLVFSSSPPEMNFTRVNDQIVDTNASIVIQAFDPTNPLNV